MSAENKEVENIIEDNDIEDDKIVRRQEDIERITAKNIGMSRKDVKSVFDGIWDTICNEIENGNDIKLHGKGVFYLSKRKARMGRNPITLQEHEVPKREVMAFQVSPAYAKKLREIRKQANSK